MIGSIKIVYVLSKPPNSYLPSRNLFINATAKLEIERIFLSRTEGAFLNILLYYNITSKFK